MKYACELTYAYKLACEHATYTKMKDDNVVFEHSMSMNRNVIYIWLLNARGMMNYGMIWLNAWLHKPVYEWVTAMGTGEYAYDWMHGTWHIRIMIIRR